jgi:hypothetical protein
MGDIYTCIGEGGTWDCSGTYTFAASSGVFQIPSGQDTFTVNVASGEILYDVGTNKLLVTSGSEFKEVSLT